MKILVIGGNGFLGSHVFDQLNNIYKKNIYLLDKDTSLYKKNLNIIKGDISDLSFLKKKLKGFDIVYHFAGISDLDQAYENPTNTVKDNILGTVNILEACRLNKVKKIIFASTMYVAGNHGSFYRCSKSACEEYVKEYKRRFGLDYVIIRYGSLYGPRSDSRNGLYKIIKETLNKNQIKYFGDINSTREYIHVFDAAKATIEILNKKYLNQSINITGQQSIKIIDLLKIIKEIMNIKKPIQIIKKKNIGHYLRVPHNYEENLSLKYTTNPFIDFGEGLTNLIKNISKDSK
jgi:UDP-glucose 4-epimerase